MEMDLEVQNECLWALSLNPCYKSIHFTKIITFYQVGKIESPPKQKLVGIPFQLLHFHLDIFVWCQAKQNISAVFYRK